MAVPDQQLAVTVLCNSLDGFTWPWVDGILQILQTFQKFGAASRRSAGWQGRYWSLWGPVDLVPLRDRVLVASPTLAAPFTDATQLSPRGKDHALSTEASGFANFGEAARLVRTRRGDVAELWLAGSRCVPEAAAAREVRRRFEP